MPFKSLVPRSSSSKSCPRSLRVPSLITTVFGLAMLWRRAARFGVYADDARGQVPHRDHPSRDADPDLLALAGLHPGDRRNEFKPGPHRSLGVVFMSVRMTKVHQDPVAHILRDVSTKLAYGFFGTARISGEDISQIFRIHADGERRRPDQVSEHHRDLTAFGLVRSARPRHIGNLRLGAQLGNQTQNSPTIPEKDAELLKIIVRKIWQNGKINPVFGKAVRVVG